MADDRLVMDVRTRLKSIASKGGRYFTGTAGLFLASGKHNANTAMPTIGKMVEVNKDLMNDTVKFLRNPVDTINRGIDRAMQTEGWKAFKRVADAAIDDLKSGNLYDPDRDRTSFNDDNEALLDNFGDVDMSGFDEGGDYGDIDIDNFEPEIDLAEAQEQAEDTRTEATIDAIGTSTEAIVSTQNSVAQLDIRTSIKQHSQLMNSMENIITQQAATISVIDNMTNSMLDVTREAHNQIMEQMSSVIDLLTGIKENTAPPTPEEPYRSSNPTDFVDYQGAVNVKGWLKQVAKKVYNEYGSAFSMLSGLDPTMIADAYASNPLQLITDSIVNKIFEDSGVKKSMERTQSYLKSLIPAMLDKFTAAGKRFERDTGNAQGGSMKDFIMGLFGIQNRANGYIETRMDNASEAAAFSNRTAMAIEQVIPMWLSKIYSAISGEQERMFNYKEGKLQNVANVLAKQTHAVNDVAGRMGEGSYHIQRIAGMMQFDKAGETKEFEKYAYQYINESAKNGTMINPYVSDDEWDRAQPSWSNPTQAKKFSKALRAVIKTIPRHELMGLSAEANAGRASQVTAADRLNQENRETGMTVVHGGMLDDGLAHELEGKSQETRYGLSPAEIQEIVDKRQKTAIEKGTAILPINKVMNDTLSILKKGIITYTYIIGDNRPTETPEGEEGAVAVPRRNSDALQEILDRAADERERTGAIARNEQDIEEQRKKWEEQQDKELKKRTKRVTEITGMDTWNVHGDTPEEEIMSNLSHVQIHDRAANETDNPDVENTRGFVTSHVQNLRRRLAFDPQRGMGANIRNFLTSAPFELVKSGLEIADNLMFKLVFGENTYGLIDGEDEPPSLLRSLGISIKAHWKKATDWFAENIGKPLKDFFFGAENGLFTRLGNTLTEKIGAPIKETAGRVKTSLIGTKEVDEEGNATGKYKGGKLSDMINRTKDRIGGFKSSVNGENGGPSLIDRFLYGKYYDSDRKGTKTVGDNTEYSGFFGRLKQAGDKFKDIMFGPDDEGNDHDSKKKAKFVADELNKAAPDMLIGAGLLTAFNAGMGLLTGLALPGGPLMAPLLGAGFGFMSSSESFKKFLFGDEFEEDQEHYDIKTGKMVKKKVKTRKGTDLISKEVYDNVKRFAPKVAIGSIAGALAGGIGILPFGMGPIIGGLLGSIGGMTAASDKLKKLIFGDADSEEGDDSGLISKNFRKKFMKVLKERGGGALIGKLIGTGAGFLAGGILPGALGSILGSTLGTVGTLVGAISGPNIMKLLFGEEREVEVTDDNGRPTGEKVKKRIGGLFGKMFDGLKDSVVTPLAKGFDSLGRKIGDWFDDSIVKPFSEALKPMKEAISSAGNAIKDRLKSIVTGIGDAIKSGFENAFGESVEKPLKEFFKEHILDPLSDVTKKIFGTIGKIIGGIISAPFKAMQYIFAGGPDRETLDERRAERERKKEERDRARREKKLKRANRSFKAGAERLGGIFGILGGLGRSADNVTGDTDKGNASESEMDQVRNRGESNEPPPANTGSTGGPPPAGSGRERRRKGLFESIKDRIQAGKEKRRKRDEERARKKQEREEKKQAKLRAKEEKKKNKNKPGNGSNDERERLKNKAEADIETKNDREKDQKDKKERRKEDKVENDKSKDTSSTGGTATPTPSDKDKDKEKTKRGRYKSDNEYLKQIAENTKSNPKIFDEIKGQLGGAGWNLAYIKTLLDKHLNGGKPLDSDELPEEMEGSTRRNVQKKRTIFGKALDKVGGFFGKVGSTIKDKVGGFINIIIEPFKHIGEIIHGIGSALSTAGGLLVDTIKGIGPAIGDALSMVVDTVGTLLKGAAEGIAYTLAGVGEFIAGIAPSIGQALGDVVSTFTGVLSAGIQGIAAMTLGVVETVSAVFPDIAKGIWGGVKDIAGGIWGGVKGIAGGIAGGIKSLFSGGEKKQVEKVVKTVGTFTLAGGILEGIKNPVPVYIVNNPEESLGGSDSSGDSTVVSVNTGPDENENRPEMGTDNLPEPPETPAGNKKKNKKKSKKKGSKNKKSKKKKKGAKGAGSNTDSEENDQAADNTGVPGEPQGAVSPENERRKELEEEAEREKKAADDFKETYMSIDRRVEHAENPAEAYDEAAEAAKNKNQMDAILAAQQLNSNNQNIENDKDIESGSSGGFLSTLFNSLFGDSKIGTVLKGIGGAIAGTAVGKALISGIGTTASAIGEAGGMAATAYNLMGDSGNKLWGLQSLTQGAVSIGKAVATGSMESLDKTPIQKAIAKVIKLFLNNKTVSKAFGSLKGKLSTVATKLTGEVSGEVLEQAVESGGEQAAASSGKQIAAFASGGTIAIAFAVVDFVTGFGNAKKYFNVFSSDVSLGMRLTSGIVNALGGLLSLIPGIGPLLSVAAAMFQDKIVQLIYGILASDAAKEELAADQEKLQAATDAYNAENGTELTVDEYSKKFNEDGSSRGSIFSRIASGAKSVGSAVVSGAKTAGSFIVNGAKTVGNAVYGFVEKAPDVINNALNSLGDMIETAGKSISAFITDFPDKIVSGINGFFDKISSVLLNLPETLGELIGKIFNGGLDGVGGIAGFAIKLGGGIISGLIKIAGGVGSLVLSLAKGIGSMLVGGLKLLITNPGMVLEMFASIGGGVVKVLGSAVGGVVNLVSEIIKGIASGLWNALGDIGSAIFGDGGAAEDIGGAVVQDLEGAGDELVDLAQYSAGNFTEITGAVASTLNSPTESADILTSASDAASLSVNQAVNNTRTWDTWGMGPSDTETIDTLANNIASKVNTNASGDTLGSLLTSTFSDSDNMTNAFINIGKGIGTSFIDMATSVFKDEKKGPTIFSIMGQGLGASLLDDLKNVEGKNATINSAISTAMVSTSTGSSTEAASTTVKKTESNSVWSKIKSTVSSWLPWNWGKGPEDPWEAVPDIDDQGNVRKEGTGIWGTGPVKPMSQSSAEWNQTSNDMAKNGCGPTAAAMVASAYGDSSANPGEANAMSYKTGMRASDGGTNPSFFSKYASSHGYGMSEGPVSAGKLSSDLKNGQPAVVMGKGGAYGNNTHYLVADRVNGSSVGLVDPITGSRKSSTMGDLLDKTSTAVYSYGKGPSEAENEDIQPSDETSDASTTEEEKTETESVSTESTEGEDISAATQIAEAQEALVNKMKSVLGTLKYSLGAIQDPDQGVASCASTVGWAYRKVLGVDNMSASSTTQSTDNRFSTIWVNKGSPLDTSILQQGDILYQNWDQTKNTGAMKHTEMYAGNNQDISHGGGIGPKMKDLNDYRKKHTMMVRRYTPFVNEDDVVILDSGTSGTTTNADGTTSDESSSTSSTGSSILDALSTVFSGLSSKLGNILTLLLGGSVEDSESSTDTTSDSTSDTSATINVSDSDYETLTPTEYKDKIWKFLRKDYGLNETGTAGLMGCWEQESSNRPDRLEGDYLKAWKNKYSSVNEVLSSNENLNDYTTNYLFPAYDKDDVSYTRSGYMIGENYYPGVGLGQWTATRAYNLLQFANENGLDWRNIDTQLKFFQQEVSTSYSKLHDALNSAGSVDAATQKALSIYELPGYSATDLSVRQEHAAAIYNTYKGTDINDTTTTADNTSSIGGGGGRTATAEAVTATAETGTGPEWGHGPEVDLTYNQTALMNSIKECNRLLTKTRDDAESDTTVSTIANTITDALGSSSSSSSDESTALLKTIATTLGTMVNLLSKISENTAANNSGTTTDNSTSNINSKYSNLPSSSPTYPSGDLSPDDIGLTIINRLTTV